MRPKLTLNRLTQFLRRRLTRHSSAQRISDASAHSQFVRAGLASLEVPENFAGGLNQKLVAEIGIELPANPGALLRVEIQHVHADSPVRGGSLAGVIPNDCATPANSWRRSFRPRLNRDITVPSGSFIVSAISL